MVSAPYQILLVVSGGLTELTHNLLESLRRCAVPSDRVSIVAPAAAIEELAALRRLYKLPEFVTLDEVVAGMPSGVHSRYFDFGSPEFGRFTLYKWLAVRRALAAGIGHVIYSDVDVAWRRDPIPMLQSIAQLYDLALPTEGIPQFPPFFCTGLMSFRDSQFSRDLLDFMIRLHTEKAASEPSLNDQDLFNRVVAQTPQMLGNIFPLPELVFANGAAATLMRPETELAKLQVYRADPVLFHANFTVGVENKKKLLQATGNWLL